VKRGLGLGDGTRDFSGPRDSVRRRGCSDNRRAGLGVDRVGVPRQRVFGQRASSEASCSRSKERAGGSGARIRPRVVEYCTSRQAMPGGGASGARASRVKPPSRGSEGSNAKSIGSSSGVERRVELESTSSEVLSVEASWFVTRRHPHGEALEAGLAEAEEGVPKGRPGRGGGDGASEGRLETGSKKTGRKNPRATTGPPKPSVSP
jgi:hypothetical protein